MLIRVMTPDGKDITAELTTEERRAMQDLATIQSLNYLRDHCFYVATSKGWYDKESEVPFNVGEKLMLVVTELAEAMEDFRNGPPGDREMVIDPRTCKPTGFPSELADVIIRIMDLAGRMEIDIGEAVVAKMRYNETRPYRHGNKQA